MRPCIGYRLGVRYLLYIDRIMLCLPMSALSLSLSLSLSLFRVRYLLYRDRIMLCLPLRKGVLLLLARPSKA
jgi:hypothetical protein